MPELTREETQSAQGDEETAGDACLIINPGLPVVRRNALPRASKKDKGSSVCIDISGTDGSALITT
jgi:hypothetical protein